MTRKFCLLTEAFCLLGFFLMFGTASAGALQGGTPEAALEEIVTADSVETIIRHLPVKVQEHLDKLPSAQRMLAAEKFLVGRNLEQRGGKLTKSSDGNSWELVEKEGEPKVVFTWKKTFTAGDDALLQFEIQEANRSQVVLVGMRYEGSEWRLSEIGEWRGTKIETEFLPEEEKPENPLASAAASTLRTLNTAIVSYASTYPETGFPPNLAALSGEDNEEATPEHARLIDSVFMRSPAVKAGYEFRYTVIGAGHYQITATPLQFSEGSRSFFTDETCVIRSTTENRPATVNDPPLE